MRIRLAVLETDISYLKRLTAVFETRYADKVEVHSFSDPKIALSSLESAKIDMLVASDAFDIHVESLPKRCGFAYLVDSPDVTTVRNRHAICKFQRVEQIFKQILSLYSETAGDMAEFKPENDDCLVVIFSSPCGGTGTTTVAAASARVFAASGKRVLYLNLEKFGSSESFFQAEGPFTMSDVIFALKNKKSNFSLKLESCVKRDACGVSFYAPVTVALDMLSVKAEEYVRLITELQWTGSYDVIVADIDFALDAEMLKCYAVAHSIVWVGDGSEISNQKILRAYRSLSVLEDQGECRLLNRCCLVYNKFSNKTGRILPETGIRSVGGAPRYTHATAAQIVDQLSHMDFLSKIVSIG